MSKKMPNDKSTNKQSTKQMKVFLSNQEHAVVTLAANIKEMNKLIDSI